MTRTTAGFEPRTLSEDQRETLERMRHDLDALEEQGASSLWELTREAELLTLGGADDPGQRARRLYSLDHIEGPEDRPRIEALADRMTADALRLGDPRSPEYRDGCAAYLAARITRHVLGGEPGSMRPCPHRIGTAAADAWFAGVDRGRATWEACLPLIEEREAR